MKIKGNCLTKALKFKCFKYTREHSVEGRANLYNQIRNQQVGGQNPTTTVLKKIMRNVCVKSALIVKMEIMISILSSLLLEKQILQR